MPCNIYKTVSKIGVSMGHISHTVDITLTAIRHNSREVSVQCVGEKKMRSMNRIFRGIDKPTDVLSFPTEDAFPGKAQTDSGDIFLCPLYIKKQAKRFGTTYKEEFTRMLIHGVLHLHGYDHIKQKDAEKMFTLQENILKKLLAKNNI